MKSKSEGVRVKLGADSGNDGSEENDGEEDEEEEEDDDDSDSEGGWKSNKSRSNKPIRGMVR